MERAIAGAFGAVGLVGFVLGLGGCPREPAYPPSQPQTSQPEGQPASPPAGMASPRAPSSDAPFQVGLATWYGKRFQGRPTSTGEPFDPQAMTAAHRKLPFGTWVEVRRADTGRSVRVRINDRGPWGDDRRIIDLSQAAFEQIGARGEGVVPVEIRIVPGP